MGSPGKTSPALQSFDSAKVQVITELQACLLLGWENHPLTCGLGTGDIHGQGNGLNSMLAGFEDPCSPSSLRSKELPIHTTFSTPLEHHDHHISNYKQRTVN